MRPKPMSGARPSAPSRGRSGRWRRLPCRWGVRACPTTSPALASIWPRTTRAMSPAPNSSLTVDFAQLELGMTPAPAFDRLTGARDKLSQGAEGGGRSEEHTSELQSLMRISYAVFCLKKKKKNQITQRNTKTTHNTDANN